MPPISKTFQRFKTRALCLAAVSALAVLAGCGGAPTGGQIEARKTVAPPPPIAGDQTAIAADGLSASDTLTPVMPTGEAKAEEIAAEAAPPTGTAEERIARLEAQVSALRSDYNRIMPAFASLNTTNERIQTLLSEIERQGGLPAQVASAETPIPANEEAAAEQAAPGKEAQAAAISPAAAPSDFSIVGVRTGDHGGKSRIVVDVTGKGRPEFATAFDESKKQFLVEIKGAGWNGKSGKSTVKSSFLNGWSVQNGQAQGQTIAVDLKKTGKLVSSEYLPATGKTPARLVFDIAPAL